MASEKVSALAEKIKALSIPELGELLWTLEELFSPSCPVIDVFDFGCDAEQQLYFDVVLKAPGNNKLKVIQIVRAETGLGLMEAKALVDNCPCVLKKALPKEDAENLMEALTEAGADAELK